MDLNQETAQLIQEIVGSQLRKFPIAEWNNLDIGALPRRVKQQMKSKKIAFIFGTRPEGIKLAPLIREFQRYPHVFSTLVINTAQHREMLDQVLNLFHLIPDYDLGIMEHDQTLSDITSKALKGLDQILATESPDLIVVQGDTTTTFVGALAAFYHRIPVVHVEAGLRTGDRFRPFPEEVNRRLTSVIADLHFAATEQARQNLIHSGIPDLCIRVTGNTVIDALLWVLEQPYQFPANLAPLFNGHRSQRILVTAHRRENHGAPLRDICRAIADVVRNIPDVEVIFPVHLSPRVRCEVNSLLGGNDRIHLLPPLEYQPFVHAMRSARLILTDSGGVQEEAPSLGVPVLVLRQETERPEAVLAGTVKIVGADPKTICNEVHRLLSDEIEYKAMARSINPYGDGHACPRIVKQVASHLNVTI